MALAVPMVTLLAVFSIDRASCRGEVLRGVSVSGVALAGLDSAATQRAIEQLDLRLAETRATVRVAGRSFELQPQQVGFRVDVTATVDAAMSAGRTGNWLEQLRWWLGRWVDADDLQPATSMDPKRLEQLLVELEGEAIEDPPFEGAVQAREGRLVPEYPRPGHRIDRIRAQRVLADGLRRQQREPVDLPLSRVEPQRGKAVVDAAVQRAQKLVSAPVVLVRHMPTDSSPQPPDGAKGESSADDAAAERVFELRLSPSQLAGALCSRPGEGEDLPLELYFDPEAIEPLLGEARSKLEVPPRDASFELDERDRVTIVPSRSGNIVDAAQVAAAVLEAVRTPLRRGEFPLKMGAAPELSTQQAEALQIRQLVSKFTTHHPCCRPRVENIHRIAELVDGTVVKPGERLSLNELVGRRTRKKRFVPAPAIEEGEMVDTIGGGISQFATTMFNAALRGGYDIIERTPHTFYFRRYPMGWDATLSHPKPDLVIRNNTNAGLLIKTEHTPVSITVKLFGDDGGCTVRLRKSRVMDVVKPPVEYTGDRQLDPERVKVRYQGMVGWSVIVSRTRTYPDGTEKNERRKVTYQPRPRRVDVHPCRIPKGEAGYTGEPCPKPDDEVDGGPAGAEATEPRGAGGASSAADLIPPGLLDDGHEP